MVPILERGAKLFSPTLFSGWVFGLYDLRYWFSDCPALNINSIKSYIYLLLLISYFASAPFPLSILWNYSEYYFCWSGIDTPTVLHCLNLSILIHYCNPLGMIIGEWKLLNDLTTAKIPSEVDYVATCLFHAIPFSFSYL